MKVLFPDTNLLIECRHPQELPWCDIDASCTHFRLILAREVVREIDRFKSDPKKRRSRKARKLNGGLFRRLLELSGKPYVIKESDPRVDVKLNTERLRPELFPELDLSTPDDAIIAAAISHSSMNPGLHVALLTNDTFALHTASALDLSSYRIPESWLLPPEPDSRQKAIERLESRIRLLEVQSPKFTIRGPASRKLTGTIVNHEEFSVEEIEKIMDIVDKTLPMASNFDQPPPAERQSTLQIYRSPAAHEIKNYRDRLYPEWRESLKAAIVRLPSRMTQNTNLIPVAVEIDNTGSAPGKDVVFEFWLSKGLQFRHPKVDPPTCGSEYTLPRPPEPPAGSWGPDFSVPGDKNLAIPRHLSDLTGILNRDSHRRDPNTAYYKTVPKDHARKHHFECAIMRHGVEPEIFDFQIQADDEIRGGELTCRVTASNLTVPVLLKIPVEIRNVSGSSFETALSLLSNLCEG